ncbi:MAG: hypothetical protein F4187_04930 [Gemmatimonadetes bacterium]|nr:hypothetical protein [Gemmatimonadota bacterium]
MDGCDALAPRNRKRCDFLLFFESSRSTPRRPRRWAVPIELKSGTIKAVDLAGIREQVQCGADVARKLMSAVGGDGASLRPILGYGSMQRHVALMLTREYRVDIGGRSELIRDVPCGDSIDSALK